MKTLHVIVSNKIATFSHRDGNIICGNADYQIQFHFDSEWSAHESKTARFIWGGKHKDVIFTGTACPVPIVANTKQIEVGVYVEGLSTSTPAKIPCERSILCRTITNDDGTVIIPENAPVLLEKTITENGTYTPGSEGDGFSKVTVQVPETTGGGAYKNEWNESTPYSTDDVVTYEGDVYLCKFDGCVGYNPIQYIDMCWQKLNTASNGAYKGEFEWSASYVAGDVVTSNGDVYLATGPTPNGYPSIEYFGWPKLNS